MVRNVRAPISIGEAQRDPQLIRASLKLPGVAIELCDFPEVTAGSITLVETSPVLALGLSPLLSNSEGRFGGVGCRFARFGALSYRPAGVPSELRFAGGAFETIRCRFDASTLPTELTSDNLGEAQLAACFDIRVQTIEDAMLRLAQEVTHLRSDSPELARALVRTIRIDLARYLESVGQLAARRRGGLTPVQLRKVIALIDEPGRPPSVADLADVTGLSRFHFMRTFHASTGESVGGFVQQARMARAKAMLARDDQSLTEIAGSLGFQSAAAFGAAFSRAVGRPPGAFRTQLRN